MEALVQRAIDDHGRLDILVNNAGTSAGGAFLGVTDEAWQHDLDLKLYGAIRASRLAVPLMREQGGGRIINVTNLGAKAPARPPFRLRSAGPPESRSPRPCPRSSPPTTSWSPPSASA